jgi:hypothetical protein
VAVGHLRLRPPPPPVQDPVVRAVPDPSPPGQVSFHDAGPAVARGVHIEPRQVAGIMPIGEGPARAERPHTTS